MLLAAVVGVGVGDYLAVHKADYPCRIPLGKLGVMGDHYNEPVFGYLLEQIHYLNAGLGVKRARRLVGKQYLGVVDQRSGDSHTLHLTARHLIGLLAELIAETDLLKGDLCTLPALLSRNA